jgi:uncharacterized membrane protein
MTSAFKFASAFMVTLCLASVARAEDTIVTVCNHNSDRAIYATYMKQAGASAGWQSNGWFEAAANACTDIDVGVYTGNVFMYAEDQYEQTNWGEGSQQYCVNKTSAFSINNADIAPCTDSTLKKVNSDQLAVTPGKTEWDVNPNFSQLNFCNQNTTFDIVSAFANPVSGNLDSQGWYTVPAGKCTLVTVGKYTGPVDYYAEYNQGELAWTGTPFQFCVNRTSAFNLPNADNAALCSTPTVKMVNARSTTVQIGSNTVNFEAQALVTTLQLCNGTTNETLNSSYAISTSGGLWQSNGWESISPGTCTNIGLGSYTGLAYFYAEWNLGQTYWGSGPFNFCVNRTENFTIADAANAGSCNSSTAFKMVPAYSLSVAPGVNTFTFK